jgi:hypothetical protein
MCAKIAPRTMFMLKENAHEIVLGTDYATTFRSLRLRLSELHIGVEKEDMDKGTITAQCLTGPIKMVLWRCWNDRIVFEIKRIDAANTRVRVFTVPNLFRFKVEKNERPIEVNDLVCRLFD